MMDIVKKHSDTAPQSDDIAMMMIRYNGSHEDRKQQNLD
jgi:hypothetical protein